jgi:hypothetical protein
MDASDIDRFVLSGEAIRLAEFTPVRPGKQGIADGRAIRRTLKQYRSAEVTRPKSTRQAHRVNRIGTRGSFNNIDTGTAILLKQGSRVGANLKWRDREPYEAYTSAIRKAIERGTGVVRTEGMTSVVSFQFKLPAGKGKYFQDIIPLEHGTMCDIYLPRYAYLMTASTVEIEINPDAKTVGIITVSIQDITGVPPDPSMYIDSVAGVSSKDSASTRALTSYI